MSTLQIASVPGKTVAGDARGKLDRIAAMLESCFGVEFTLVDTSNDQVVSAPNRPASSPPPLWLELCRMVAQRGRPEFICDDEPLLALALPIPIGTGIRYVAVGLFLSAKPAEQSDRRWLARLERTLGWSRTAVAHWVAEQSPWPAARLMAIAETLVARFGSDVRVEGLDSEVSELSANLAATYEEISLLHRLTQHLRLSESDEGLARLALEWLADTMPVESLALEMRRPLDGDEAKRRREQPLFVTLGKCPVDQAGFENLLKRLGLEANVRSVVMNTEAAAEQLGEASAVRQVILVPLTEGQHVFGWLAAFGHRTGGEFGSPEANLLASVAAILGVHSGNSELYRQQAEFLAGVVRALTSAIDAKDPYTCGHSDRVARIAVLLAAELGCDRQQLDTVYLSGLLHDVGKIGIDDSVLRKPGKLTNAEFEHIKLHPEIGFRILGDLKQLGDVLPVVRHHHEAWDGEGYPMRLSGEQIPLMARIVAVADAFDAMSSDRPYRQGMDDEQLDDILRQGAGQQWDRRVVGAFFRIRDKIRELSRRDSPCEPVHDEIRRLV